MEKVLASKILDSALALGKGINELDSLISGIESANERKEFVDALGRIMGVVSGDIISRILRKYPDLDPDKES